jgi:membrane protein YqaA with SNARE-associated domain
MSDWIWLVIGFVGGGLGSVFFYRLGYKIGRHDAEDDFADRTSMERRGRTQL